MAEGVCAWRCKHSRLCVWCCVRPDRLGDLLRHRGGVFTGVRLAGVHATLHVLVTGVECDVGTLCASHAFGAYVSWVEFCIGFEVCS